jgi:hypothetical protein
MKLADLYDELQASQTYKEFKESYPDSYLSAGFFILSKEEKEPDKFQLDCYIPKEKKMASFEYPFNSHKVHDDIIENQKEITKFNLIVDIPDISNKVKEVTNKEYPKIIAIFQNNEWNLACLLGMDLRRIKINAYTGESKDEEAIKLSDMIKIKKTSKEEQ